MFTNEEINTAVEQMDMYLEFGKKSGYNFVVVESEDFCIRGFLSYGPAPLTRGVYHLYWMAVSPRTQNHGYGREMILWLFSRLKVFSARMLLVETSSMPKYLPARKFYRSLGFRMVSRLPNYYDKGDDLIFFGKSFEKHDWSRNGRVAGTFAAQH
jgi:ribosomal protein S18 acetylase RimI-like enzyme